MPVRESIFDKRCFKRLILYSPNVGVGPDTLLDFTRIICAPVVVWSLKDVYR
jgi:hypothetical protein